MKASKADIIFFHKLVQLILEGAKVDLSFDELKEYLKYYADLEGKSCGDMTHDELQQLKEWSKHFAVQIGVELKDIDE